MLKQTFTTREVAKLAGYRTAMMVDYLNRQEIIRPSVLNHPGRGRARLYSFGDVVLLRAVNRLLATGLPVSRLKAALKKLQRDFKHLSADTVLKRFLITDGRDVILEDEPGALVNLSSGGQMAFAFIVDIEHARKEVMSATKSLEKGPLSA
jgi:DNA-binding transcriptional MerR regulator